MPANAWLPPMPPGGDRHPRTHPSRSICPPRPPAETPSSTVSQAGTGDGEKEPRPTRAGRCGQRNRPAVNPQMAHQADPSCLGPHLGPQGRWLVRSTRPISPHVRALPVQEGRVPDISEVSAQFPLGLRGDTAAGPRGQATEEEGEKAGGRLRARSRPGLAGPRLTSQEWGPGSPHPTPTEPTHRHSARLS